MPEPSGEVLCTVGPIEVLLVSTYPRDGTTLRVRARGGCWTVHSTPTGLRLEAWRTDQHRREEATRE